MPICPGARVHAARDSDSDQVRHENIDHGQLADDASVKLMAEKGFCWSLQPFLEDEDTPPNSQLSPFTKKKYEEMTAGTDIAYALADLLLVDGNPTSDLNLIADPQKNLKIIMKDGRIHKNAV